MPRWILSVVYHVHVNHAKSVVYESIHVLDHMDYFDVSHKSRLIKRNFMVF